MINSKDILSQPALLILNKGAKGMFVSMESPFAVHRAAKLNWAASTCIINCMCGNVSLQLFDAGCGLLQLQL